jgi:transposase
MRRFQFEDAETTKVALQQEIARSSESRYDHRLHGLLLLCRGMSSYEVGEILGHSPRTIQYWYRRYQEGGFAALMDAEGRGRRSSLNDAQWAQLAKDLRESPETFGYSQGPWDGNLLSHHLKQAFGLDLGTRQCQRIFHKMGFRRRKPRGVIAGADPEAQQAYKKTPAMGPPERPRSLESG